MPLKEQFDINIEKKRIDKKVREMEYRAEEQNRKALKNKSKVKKFKAYVAKVAAAREKGLFK